VSHLQNVLCSFANISVLRVEETIKADVALLRASPFIRKDVQVVGLKYDIMTGVVSEVEV
jgi:carbonic anhydrase